MSPPSVLLGSQLPAFQSHPPSRVSLGADAVERAASAGLFLDEWQQRVLDGALGIRADGCWAAFEVGLVVPRQNGKSAALEAVMLHALFDMHMELSIYTAHEFKTATEMYRRVNGLIEAAPDLNSQVKRRVTSTNEMGVELRDGCRLRFLARSRASGRGFSADLLIFDEAMVLSAETMGAILPTLSARANPQVWFAGSAGLAESDQFRHVRDRGRAGGSDRLAYFEWTAERLDGQRPDPVDPVNLAAANPGLGTRLRLDVVDAERDALPEPILLRERYGVWDEPGANYAAALPLDAWTACTDTASCMQDPVAFAVDVSPDRAWASIGAAGWRDDGLPHVEVIDNRPGTAWVTARILELLDRWTGSTLAMDQGGPAGSLLQELTDAGLDVQLPTTREFAQSCGAFYDAVVSDRLRHRGQPTLGSAVGASRRRTLGEAWAWTRQDTGADITPLVAVTVALWALPPPAEFSIFHFDDLDDDQEDASEEDPS